MEIEFELIDKKNIKIIGIENGKKQEVGCIFTPSSSGENITNAIQICGISEAYDFWGCSRYIQPRDLNPPKRVIGALKGEKEDFIQSKDIQLMFSMETKPAWEESRSPDFDKDCLRCFNKPCTCETKEKTDCVWVWETENDRKQAELLGRRIKEMIKLNNPYKVKREEEVPCEYLNDGKIHLKPKESEELLNKLK